MVVVVVVVVVVVLVVLVVVVVVGVTMVLHKKNKRSCTCTLHVDRFITSAASYTRTWPSSHLAKRYIIPARELCCRVYNVAQCGEF